MTSKPPSTLNTTKLPSGSLHLKPGTHSNFSNINSQRNDLTKKLYNQNPYGQIQTSTTNNSDILGIKDITDVGRTTDQSVSTGTFNVINWNSASNVGEIITTDILNNNGEIIIQDAGTYMVTAYIECSKATSGSTIEIRMQEQTFVDTILFRETFNFSNAIASSTIHMNSSNVVKIEKPNTTFEVSINQNGTGSYNVTSNSRVTVMCLDRIVSNSVGTQDYRFGCSFTENPSVKNEFFIMLTERKTNDPIYPNMTNHAYHETSNQAKNGSEPIITPIARLKDLPTFSYFYMDGVYDIQISHLSRFTTNNSSSRYFLWWFHYLEDNKTISTLKQSKFYDGLGTFQTETFSDTYSVTTSTTIMTPPFDISNYTFHPDLYILIMGEASNLGRLRSPLLYDLNFKKTKNSYIEDQTLTGSFTFTTPGYTKNQIHILAFEQINMNFGNIYRIFPSMTSHGFTESTDNARNGSNLSLTPQVTISTTPIWTPTRLSGKYSLIRVQSTLETSSAGSYTLTLYIRRYKTETNDVDTITTAASTDIDLTNSDPINQYQLSTTKSYASGIQTITDEYTDQEFTDDLYYFALGVTDSNVRFASQHDYSIRFFRYKDTIETNITLFGRVTMTPSSFSDQNDIAIVPFEYIDPDLTTLFPAMTIHGYSEVTDDAKDGSNLTLTPVKVVSQTPTWHYFRFNGLYNIDVTMDVETDTGITTADTVIILRQIDQDDHEFETSAKNLSLSINAASSQIVQTTNNTGLTGASVNTVTNSYTEVQINDHNYYIALAVDSTGARIPATCNYSITLKKVGIDTT